MSVVYGAYILSKTDMMIILFEQFRENDHISFISEIDKWDWEVESTIEGYAQLSDGVILLSEARKRVGIKSSKTQLAIGLRDLISSWNLLVRDASVTYSVLSEGAKKQVAEVDIDFNLYLKERIL